MLGKICTTVLDALSENLQRPLNIVETGTAYIMHLEPGEKDLSARSTIAIAEWVKKNGGRFTSIDVSASHQRDCRKKLEELELGGYTYFRTGHGPEVLRDYFDPVDFLLLDADSGGETTYNEFIAIRGRVNRPGIIVIDDAFKHPSVNKAQKVVPVAYRENILVVPLGQAVALSFGADDILKGIKL